MLRMRLLQRALWLCACLFALAILGAGAIVWDGLNDNLYHADVGVVLGSKVELSGRPSLRLKARLDHAAELYHSKHFPAIIVSGGIGREGFNEAVVMRDYLVERGIPVEAITVDSRGITTAATAINTRAILQQHDWHSVLVVTQYFHVSRSVLAMRRCGISNVYSAGARYFEWRDLYSIPRELAGYISYLFKTYDA
jgi:vancomycin permeability regulator SanA